jgi:hypothetical protein
MSFFKIIFITSMLIAIKGHSFSLQNSSIELSNQCENDSQHISIDQFKGIESLRYIVNVDDFGTCPSDQKNDNHRIRLSTETVDRTKDMELQFDFALSNDPSTWTTFFEFDNWAKGCEFSNPSVLIGTQSGKLYSRYIDENKQKQKSFYQFSITKINEWNSVKINLSPTKNNEIYNFSYTQNNQEIFNYDIFIGGCAELEFSIGPFQKNGQGENYKFYLSNINTSTGLNQCDKLKYLSQDLKILFVSASTLSYRKKLGKDEPGCEETAEYLALELNNKVDNYARGGGGVLVNNTNAPHDVKFGTIISGIKLTDYDWIVYGAGAGLNFTDGGQQSYQVINQLLNSKATDGLLLRKFNDFFESGGKLILAMPTQFSQNNKNKKYHRLLKSGFTLIDRIKILEANRDDVFFVGFQDGLVDPDDKSFYLDTFDGIHLSPKGHQIIAQKFAEIIKNN